MLHQEVSDSWERIAVEPSLFPAVACSVAGLHSRPVLMRCYLQTEQGSGGEWGGEAVDFPVVYAFLGSLFDASLDKVDHVKMLQQDLPVQDRRMVHLLLANLTAGLRRPETASRYLQVCALAAACDLQGLSQTRRCEGAGHSCMSTCSLFALPCQQHAVLHGMQAQQMEKDEAAASATDAAVGLPADAPQPANSVVHTPEWHPAQKTDS